jgi:biotin carboxylase
MSALNVVVIVDPYSTGALYASAFQQLGLSCWAVRSSDNVPDHFTNDFRPRDFARVFASAADLLREFVPGSVRAVVAGCETGVALADRLAAELGVAGNNPATSRRRRHKDEMQKALQQAGLRHIRSFAFQNLAEFEATSSSFEDDEYVVKPINSAATDGVRFVAGGRELQAAMRNAAWGTRNDLGEVNEGFIVQEFIPGPEFVVDMVGFAGQYVTASICRYNKREINDAKFVYYGLDTLNTQDTSFIPLLDYARKAARSLGIIIGPVHMELIWNEQGPVMIEAASRLHGGVAPRLFGACYLPDLLSLSVQSYAGGGVSMDGAYMKRFGRIAFLISERMGKFAGLETEEIEAMQRLPTYCGHKMFVRRGEMLKRTVDFATCPGVVWLAGSDSSNVEHDEMVIRRLLQLHLNCDASIAT